MSLNRVRSLFRISPAVLRPLCGQQSKIIPPNFASRFRNYSTAPEPNVLPLKADVKMKIEFTCKVCNTRNKKHFSRTAYTHGVVIIRCDGCSNNHLIADNLKWFGDKSRNIEDILAEKGIQASKDVTDFTADNNAQKDVNNEPHIYTDQKET